MFCGSRMGERDDKYCKTVVFNVNPTIPGGHKSKKVSV